MRNPYAGAEDPYAQRRSHVSDEGTVDLGGGVVGWCSRRPDDCLAPAIATLLQISLEQVPDPRIDERLAAGDAADVIVAEAWSELHSWARERGLVLRVHDTPPDAERWIAVARLRRALCLLLARTTPDQFSDHAFVMAGREILFNPSTGVPAPPGQAHLHWWAFEFVYAVTLDREEQ